MPGRNWYAPAAAEPWELRRPVVAARSRSRAHGCTELDHPIDPPELADRACAAADRRERLRRTPRGSPFGLDVLRNAAIARAGAGALKRQPSVGDARNSAGPSHIWAKRRSAAPHGGCRVSRRSTCSVSVGAATATLAATDTTQSGAAMSIDRSAHRWCSFRWCVHGARAERVGLWEGEARRPEGLHEVQLLGEHANGARPDDSAGEQGIHHCARIPRQHVIAEFGTAEGDGRGTPPVPSPRVGPADAVVIGAGPNGLVAANLLADAGWRVARARGAARARRRGPQRRAHASRASCTTSSAPSTRSGIASPVHAGARPARRTGCAGDARRSCSRTRRADGRCAVLSTDGRRDRAIARRSTRPATATRGATSTPSYERIVRSAARTR